VSVGYFENSASLSCFFSRRAPWRALSSFFLDTPFGCSRTGPKLQYTADSADEEIRQLPVWSHRQSILAHIAEHRVTCLQGETGCGKSTLIPLLLLQAQEAAGRGGACSIVVTQPRRIAATSLAKRVASLCSQPLGQSVGCDIASLLQRCKSCES
jgi:hypothetical protein